MIPENLLNTAVQSGFNAVLVLVLLYYGRQDLAAQRKAMDSLRKSINESNKLVVHALLQLAAVVPGQKAQLQAIEKEMSQPAEPE